MWILPKQLHTSAFVPDTAALISDLAEQSQICEPSLLARSKPSLARTWSQKWKRDSWTQHLSGRILKPSHGQSFVTAWTSSLEVIPASHSQQQASDSDETTLDTSGLGSQMELFPCDPESAFSRTSKDTSPSDSEKSSANWKALVIKRRGEYSLRVKSAHLTNASESSSWASITANDWKGSTPNSITRKDGKSRIDQLAYQTEQHSLYYPTPCAMEAEKAGFHAKGQMGQSLSAMANRGELGQAVPANPSTLGSRQGSWLTPRANEPDSDPNFAARNADRGAHCHGTLSSQAKQLWPTITAHTPDMESNGPNGHSGTYLAGAVKQWGTPTARDHKSGRGNEEREYKELTPMVERTQIGKLNPRWVETLMGLPIGWTMPSCSSPLTIAQTNSDCLATESCLPPQKELF